jgi:hypothetical protein
MPGFDRDQAAIDDTVENRRLGSVFLSLGWILLWFDAMLGVFFFISLRSGSWFWPIWLGIEGALGLALVMMGTHYRRAVGPTKLGQRDLQHTLEQQRRNDAEDHQVA